MSTSDYCFQKFYPTKNVFLISQTLRTLKFHGAESFLKDNSLSGSQESSPPFIESENSLPFLQESATGPCPESDESSPQFLKLFP